jgi:hypothetical protein
VTTVLAVFQAVESPDETRLVGVSKNPNNLDAKIMHDETPVGPKYSMRCRFCGGVALKFRTVCLLCLRRLEGKSREEAPRRPRRTRPT